MTAWLVWVWLHTAHVTRLDTIIVDCAESCDPLCGLPD